MVVPHKRTRSDVLLTRSPLAIGEQALHAAVRLACVRHAASVQSEPGSNSSVQSLFFNLFVKRGRLLITLAGIDQTLCSLFNFPCFQVMSTGRIASPRFLISRRPPCGFAFSPRSRLSVRCLVFKELFVAASAATRLKFYKNLFYLVKSISKNLFLV